MGRLVLTEENQSTWRRPVPVTLYPPQVSHGLALQYEGGDRPSHGTVKVFKFSFGICSKLAALIRMYEAVGLFS
jgi:hypothetical protein